MLGILLMHGRRGLPAIPRMTMVRAHWVDGVSLPARAALASTV
jgi:hypothetical protein